MPCYTVTINQVDLALTDHGLTLAALQGLGYIVTYQDQDLIGFLDQRGNPLRLYRDSGRLEGQNISAAALEKVAKNIKKQYSVQAVTLAAKRAGWSLKKRNDQKLELRRR